MVSLITFDQHGVCKQFESLLSWQDISGHQTYSSDIFRFFSLMVGRDQRLIPALYFLPLSKRIVDRALILWWKTCQRNNKRNSLKLNSGVSQRSIKRVWIKKNDVETRFPKHSVEGCGKNRKCIYIEGKSLNLILFQTHVRHGICQKFYTPRFSG